MSFDKVLEVHTFEINGIPVQTGDLICTLQMEEKQQYQDISGGLLERLYPVM